MSKIGLFYGPMDGSVAKVARIIADKLGSEKLDLIPVRSATSEDVNKYENIIFGISTIGSHTWARETPSKDWDEFLPELDKINYNGKIYPAYDKLDFEFTKEGKLGAVWLEGKQAYSQIFE